MLLAFFVTGFLDFTLQGLINSAVTLAGLSTLYIAWRNHKAKLNAENEEAKRNLQKQIDENRRQQRELEADRRRIELEAEGRKDSILVQVVEGVSGRVTELEKQLAIAHEMTTQAQRLTEEVRQEKHSIQNQWFSERLAWERERSDMLLKHERALAEINYTHEQTMNKLTHECEDNITKLTAEVAVLREKVKTLEAQVIPGASSGTPGTPKESPCEPEPKSSSSQTSQPGN